MKKSKAEQLIKEKLQRVNDAINLKEPDRVPITPSINAFFPAEQEGFSYKDAMYKGGKFYKAARKICMRYEWDLYPDAQIAPIGRFLDAFGAKTFKWPGAHNPEDCLGDNQPFQATEIEYMKAEDYDKFLKDPTGYMLRNVIPAQNTNLKAFKDFPDLDWLCGMFSGIGVALWLMNKDLKKFRNSMRKAYMGMIGQLIGLKAYKKKLERAGKPLGGMTSGMVQAPFDMISDMIRGMRGAMLDMYKHPEELKKACDLLIEPQLNTLRMGGGLTASIGCMTDGAPPLVFIPLHRGADGFMSNKQFEQFYWPGLKKVMEGLIEIGLIPEPFFEGGYNERLVYLTEFAKEHKGQVVYWFDRTDIRKAKEMMGDYVCIRGNIPASLFVTGTPKQMDEYVKKCIEDCAEGGGYLVDGGVVGIPNEARHENVAAMTEAVYKYGVYRK